MKTEAALRMELADKLLDARTIRRYPVKFVALELCVSRNTVTNWESGRTCPDAVQVVLLAILYECPVTDLLPVAETRP